MSKGESVLSSKEQCAGDKKDSYVQGFRDGKIFMLDSVEAELPKEREHYNFDETNNEINAEISGHNHVIAEVKKAISKIRGLDK
jgi:hypothetical protein